MKLAQIISALEEAAPVKLQEEYDNSGLIIGDPDCDITKALICVDVAPQVMEEAKERQCNLVISHHPLLFKRIKKLTSGKYMDHLVIQAVKHDIAVYAMHTNLDNAYHGVSWILGQKVGLVQSQVLTPRQGWLFKLVTFCPVEHADRVRLALFHAGAGFIGNYDSCSFNMEGKGTFRGLEGSKPFVGETGHLHFENEVRMETIFPAHLERLILRALIDAHPYEEVAYDIYPLTNEYERAGAGVIGELDHTMREDQFLNHVKAVTGSSFIRHSALRGKGIRKVAICGGSGSFLIHDAIAQGADVFLTADLKYHDFFEGNRHTLLVDVGHYESEQFTKELIASILIKKFPNFVVLLTEHNTNAVHYF